MRSSNGFGRDKARELLDSLERQQTRLQFREKESQYYTKTDDIIEFRIQRVPRPFAPPPHRVSGVVATTTDESAEAGAPDIRPARLNLPTVDASRRSICEEPRQLVFMEGLKLKKKSLVADPQILLKSRLQSRLKLE